MRGTIIRLKYFDGEEVNVDVRLAGPVKKCITRRSAMKADSNTDL